MVTTKYFLLPRMCDNRLNFFLTAIGEVEAIKNKNGFENHFISCNCRETALVVSFSPAFSNNSSRKVFIFNLFNTWDFPGPIYRESRCLDMAWLPNICNSLESSLPYVAGP